MNKILGGSPESLQKTIPETIHPKLQLIDTGSMKSVASKAVNCLAYNSYSRDENGDVDVDNKDSIGAMVLEIIPGVNYHFAFGKVQGEVYGMTVLRAMATVAHSVLPGESLDELIGIMTYGSEEHEKRAAEIRQVEKDLTNGVYKDD